MRGDVLEEGYARAERITKARAKSFAFASYALGRETRRSAFAVYAFCRGCDDAVDEGDKATRGARAAELRHKARSVFAGEPQHDPILAAFADVVARHRVPEHAVSELIDGMERDLVQTRYTTYRELETYCQQAAGTVGIMMASIFDAHEPDALGAAAALGRAMQLTNVLRDVREDLVEHDRVYVPSQMLEAAGIGEDDLRGFAARSKLHGPKAEPFRDVMRELAKRARLLYEWGDEGVPAIPSRSARACVRLMRSSYAEILRVLEERGWDPFLERAHAPLQRKIKAAARHSVLSTLPFELRLVLS